MENNFCFFAEYGFNLLYNRLAMEKQANKQNKEDLTWLRKRLART